MRKSYTTSPKRLFKSTKNPITEKNSILPQPKKIISSFGHLALGEFSSKAFGFFTTIYLARSLGVEQFGTYSWVMAIYAYALLFANFGFETYGTIEIASSKSPETIGGITYLRLLYSVVAFLLALLLSLFLPANIRFLLIAQSANTLLVPLYLQFVFRGLNLNAIVAWSRFLQSGLFFVLVLLFVQNNNVILLPALWAVSTLASHLPLFFLVRKRFPTAFRLPSLEKFDEVFRRSVLIGTSGSIILVYLNFDTIILGIFSSASQIANYTAAFKIYFLGYSIIGLYYLAFLPTIPQSADRENSVVLIKQFSSLLYIAAGYIGFAGYFLSGPVILGLFGRNFDQAIGAMKVLFFSLSVSCLSTAFMNPFQMVKEEKKYIRLHLIRTSIFLVLCLILIPMYGLMGAAISTLTAEVFIVCIAGRQFSQYFKINDYRTMILSCVSGALLFLIGIILQNVFAVPPVIIFALFSSLFLLIIIGITRKNGVVENH